MNKKLVAAAVLSLNFPSSAWCGPALESLINTEMTSQAAAGAGSAWGAHQIGTTAMDGAQPSFYADTADGRGGRRGPGRKPGEGGGDRHRHPQPSRPRPDTSTHATPSDPGTGSPIRDAFDSIMPTAKDDTGTVLVKGFGGALIAPFYLTYVGAKAGAEEKGFFGGVTGAVGGLFMGLFALFMGPVIAVSYGFSTAMGVPPDAS